MIKLRAQPSSSSPKNKVARKYGRAGRGGGPCGSLGLGLGVRLGGLGGREEREEVRKEDRAEGREEDRKEGREEDRAEGPGRGPGGGPVRGPEGWPVRGPGGDGRAEDRAEGREEDRKEDLKEGVFWPVFGTAPLPTGTPVASPRGERKEIGTVDGIKVGFTAGFGTATLPTDASVASSRGEGVF